jgi:SAM-dependent methyltransferase
MSSDALQQNYASNASTYTLFSTTPLGKLEAQLFALCITNCSGYRVLDLGGGTGLRARDALIAGAEYVDIVDISNEMMEMGKREEWVRHGVGKGRVNWYEGDVAKSLEELEGEGGLRVEGYDLVVANGVFDHARDRAGLEGMWGNVRRYCRPGGRVCANRNYPFSKAANGRYGVSFDGFRGMEGGVRFRYTIDTKPELVFESMGLEVYYTAKNKGLGEVEGKWFEGFENVEWRETEVVKQDMEFWKEYLEDPILYVFTARKKG